MEFALLNPARILIYLLIAVCSALAAQYYLATEEAYWIIWTILFLTLERNPIKTSQQIGLILLTGLVIAIISFLANLAASALPIFILGLLLLCLALNIISFQNAQLSYCLQLSIIFAIVAASIPADTSSLLFRSSYILGGTAIAIFLRAILWLISLHGQLKRCLILSCQYLQTLSDQLFDCLLQPDYPDNIYLYERRIHKTKSKVLIYLALARKLINKSAKKEDTELVQVLDNLYSTLLATGQIRRRVTDHTTFSVCRDELKAIKAGLNKLFSEFQMLLNEKSLQLDTFPIASGIQKLEDNYQHVLQVSAAEPLVFILFINDLKALLAQCEHFAEFFPAKTEAAQ